MEDVVLTVEETANYLKVSEVTIRRWCADGKLPAFKIGREWRINKSELDRISSPMSRVHGARMPGDLTAVSDV